MEAIPQLRPASIAGGRFDHYFHTCGFFRSREEEYRVLAPFLAEGIAWGEKNIYIVDPELVEDHSACLCSAGVDASANPSQLATLTWDDTYLRDGKFDQDWMLGAVQDTIQASQDEGFPRTRIVGQMGWALTGSPGVDDLMEYEVRVNDVLARTRHPAICVYDVNKLSASMMMDLLRAHPMTIIGGVLYENPFYVPAEQMLEDLRSRKKSAVH